MTQPLSKIVNPGATSCYHCILRCVRHAFFIAKSKDFDRKACLDQRLRELDLLFAKSVAGFSGMDNHLHLLVRIDPDVAKSWTPLQVAQRWMERVTRMLTRNRFCCSFMSTSRGVLRQVTQKLGLRQLANTA